MTGPWVVLGLAVGAGLGAVNARAVGAALVSGLHLAFLAFMLLAPFTNNRTLLVAHFWVTPFLWLHWALNDDTCALTALEKLLRGVDDTGSYVHAVVGPVFKIADADVRLASWYASVALWCVTAYRVRLTELW